MSEPAVRAELQITFKDGATAGIKATAAEAEKAAKKLSEASTEAAKKATAETEKSTSQQRTSYEKLSRAREVLGVRSEGAIQREIQHTEAAYKRLEASGTLSSYALARAADRAREKIATLNNEMGKSAGNTEKSTSLQRSSYERFSRAREVLGIRSEGAIQREIQHTEAAYKRLEASGTLSSDALTRAAEKTREKITRLTNEMGKLTNEQRKAARAADDLEKAQSRLRTGVVGGVGGAAAAYTMKAPAVAAMSYDRRLTHMANTAYAERDEAGYKIGKKQLEDAVNKARKTGGGTREQAAEALNTMISSGTVSDVDAMKMLPGIMKASTASDTDANELAMIVLRAKQSFKIKAEDLPATLSAAMAGGQAGGFELKNMSKWLPQQMAMAGNLGLSGKEGFAKLVAWNQSSVITSGTKDEAGNNLRDLLMELNTPHFRKAIGDQLLADGKPAKKGEKEKRKANVDAVFLDYQSRGIDKVTATMDLADKIFAKDKTYAALQTKLRGIDKKDISGQREIIGAMAAQVQGTQVGQIFHNQQSLMAFLGLMNNRQYTNDVSAKASAQYSVPEDKSTTAVAYRRIAETADYKVEQAKEDAQIGQKAAMDALTPAIGRAAEMFGDLASKYPVLVGTTTLATTALVALAGASGLATIAMGGGKGGAIAQTALKYGPKAASFGRASLWGMGALAGDYALDKAFGEQSAISRYGSSALNFAATGALIGSVVPGLGTGIGAGVGGGIGLLYEALKPVYEALKPVDQKPSESHVKIDLNLPPGATVMSQSMRSTGNTTLDIATGSMGSVP